MSEPAPLVLVVEDDRQMRRFLRTTLAALDYRVVEAETVAEALVAVTTHNPDVILMDLGLPDGDGIDLTRRIRAWSRVPIIVHLRARPGGRQGGGTGRGRRRLPHEAVRRERAAGKDPGGDAPLGGSGSGERPPPCSRSVPCASTRPGAR